MRLYPIALNIAGRRCLVVGGGRVAWAKAKSLRAAQADLIVVSPEFRPEFDTLAGIERRVRPFKEDDLDRIWLAVAATNHASVNRDVALACRARGVLCNAVDAPELSDFHVPSVLERGPLLVAVSTGGVAPALAKRVRHELEELFPESYEDYIAFLDEARRLARARKVSRGERERVAALLASREGFERFVRTSPAERTQWLDEELGSGEGMG